MFQAIAIAGLLLAQTALVEGTSVNLFVSAADPTTGFVDPDLKSSAKEIAEELVKRKIVRLVDDASKSDLSLRIKKRLVRSTGSYVVVSGVAIQIDEAVLEATLSAGEYTTEISGANSGMTEKGTWKGAAKKVAVSVEKWILENRALLISRRTAKPSPSPTL